MDGETACARELPSLSIPGSPDVAYVRFGDMPRSPNACSVTRPTSIPVSPEVQRYASGSSRSSPQLPNVHIRHGLHRNPAYINKTIAYGAPNIIKKIYTGQLPATYFNDICFGQQTHPRGEFLYSAQLERQHELSSPKNVSREEARHVIRDIQDARFGRLDSWSNSPPLRRKSGPAERKWRV